MSSSMTLVGRIATQPEIRYSDKTGNAWGKFRIADNYTENDEKKSSFFDIVCFKELAENMAELAIGTRVWFSGYQIMKEWKDKSGQMRQTYELKANDGGVSLRWDGVRVEKSRPKAPAPASEESAVAVVQQGFGDGVVVEDPNEAPF